MSVNDPMDLLNTTMDDGSGQPPPDYGTAGDYGQPADQSYAYGGYAQQPDQGTQQPQQDLSQMIQYDAQGNAYDGYGNPLGQPTNPDMGFVNGDGSNYQTGQNPQYPQSYYNDQSQQQPSSLGYNYQYDPSVDFGYPSGQNTQMPAFPAPDGPDGLTTALNPYTGQFERVDPQVAAQYQYAMQHPGGPPGSTTTGRSTGAYGTTPPTQQTPGIAGSGASAYPTGTVSQHQATVGAVGSGGYTQAGSGYSGSSSLYNNPGYIEYLNNALNQSGQQFNAQQSQQNAQFGGSLGIQQQQVDLTAQNQIQNFLTQQAQLGINAFTAQANAIAQFGNQAVQQFVATQNASFQQGQLQNQQNQILLQAYLGTGQIQNDAERNAITAYLGNGQITNDTQRVLIEQATAAANIANQQGQLDLSRAAQVFAQGPVFAAQMQQQGFNQQLAEQQLGLSVAQMQQQGQLGLAGIVAGLRGPQDAYVQQAVLHGINPQGISNATAALTNGQLSQPFSVGAQAQPMPATLQSLQQQLGYQLPGQGFPGQHTGTGPGGMPMGMPAGGAPMFGGPQMQFSAPAQPAGASAGGGAPPPPAPATVSPQQPGGFQVAPTQAVQPGTPEAQVYGGQINPATGQPYEITQQTQFANGATQDHPPAGYEFDPSSGLYVYRAGQYVATWNPQTHAIAGNSGGPNSYLGSQYANGAFTDTLSQQRQAADAQINGFMAQHPSVDNYGGQGPMTGDQLAAYNASLQQQAQQPTPPQGAVLPPQNKIAPMGGENPQTNPDMGFIQHPTDPMTPVATPAGGPDLTQNPDMGFINRPPTTGNGDFTNPSGPTSETTNPDLGFIQKPDDGLTPKGVPGFARGTFRVPHTGVAVLHQGEAVLPKIAAQAVRQHFGVSGGAINPEAGLGRPLQPFVRARPHMPKIMPSTNPAKGMIERATHPRLHRFASGTFNVDQTGPAVVDQGEMVLPKDVASQFRDQSGMGQSGPISWNSSTSTPGIDPSSYAANAGGAKSPGAIPPQPAPTLSAFGAPAASGGQAWTPQTTSQPSFGPSQDQILAAATGPGLASPYATPAYAGMPQGQVLPTFLQNTKDALPDSLNQLVARNFIKEDPSTQALHIAALEAKGYAPDDINFAIQHGLPGLAGVAPGTWGRIVS